jgi:hypothetical protein
MESIMNMELGIGDNQAFGNDMILLALRTGD